jgi:molecular chaperone DnaK
MPLMQRAYADQQGAAGADAGAGAQASGGADDGVVDAEFEEVNDDKK